MKPYPTALEKYLAHPTCRLKAESSQRSLRSTVWLFQNDHPDLELHELTAKHLEDWLGGRLQSGVSDSTVQKNMQRLSSLLGWASRQGHIKQNPAVDVGYTLNLRPQAVREHTWLREGEVQEILDSVRIVTLRDHRDALILRLGFTAGLRNNEIRTLPLSSLAHIGDQRISVTGKGNKLAQVWVPEVTAELLSLWRDQYENPSPTAPVIIKFRSLLDWRTEIRTLTPQWGQGITQQVIGRIVGKRTAAAGYRITPHDMRRSYAGMIYEAGGIEKTSQALRHSNLTTTQRYIEKRQDAAAVAVETVGLNLR